MADDDEELRPCPDCKAIAASYYSDPLYRDEGPEACAESDVSYWGEE